MEVELTRYDYIEYKPRYSSKPYIYFGVGPCEEQPGGVDVVDDDAQAGRRGEGSEPGKDMFGSGQNIKSLISAWESMEEGGEEGKLTLPGGLEEGRGRRKSQKFLDICNKFGGLGVQTEGRTDKQLGKFGNICSFTDVASTLLGPFYEGSRVIGGSYGLGRPKGRGPRSCRGSHQLEAGEVGEAEISSTDGDGQVYS